jgi:cell division protein YceG involved in septum cleavage
VTPPRQRPSRRLPRSVVYRRRLVAVGVAAAGFVIAWFAVGSVRGGGGKSESTPTVTPPRPFRVVFPEGFSREQMAKRVDVVARIAERERGHRPRLSGGAYLAATTRARREPGFGERPLPLEGFLFPATYEFTARTTSAHLAAQQLSAFGRTWAKLDLGYARSKNLTPYDVLTIASMVEKETPSPDERRLVAAVIYNRLHERMPLGIDATLRYGLQIPATESIRRSQLQSSSAYNTRKRLGLPPTPIANPGFASLQAAAHPAHVDYLYFVRKPDRKHHFFTASFAAFERYKAEHGYP